MKLNNVKKIAKVILNTIKTAEDLFSEMPKSGQLKKVWVVECLNDKINIPFIGERTEAKIFGVIVDIVVEVWSDLK